MDVFSNKMLKLTYLNTKGRQEIKYCFTFSLITFDYDMYEGNKDVTLWGILQLIFKET